MSTEHTFLAVYLGSMTGPKMAAWHAMPEAERKAKEQEGMAAWHALGRKAQGRHRRDGRPARQNPQDRRQWCHRGQPMR